MTQYPHSISITTVASGWQNASGVFISGASGVYTFSCRAEVNGSGKQLAGADGVLMDYAFQVFMPLTTVVIPEGSDYVLSLINGSMSGKVKRASNGQLNSRLWL